MGSGPSRTTRKELKWQKKMNEEIEQDIALEKKEAKIKLLLLGAGECGKSTILKQMRLLHNDLSNNDRLLTKPIIYSNTTISMLNLLIAMKDLGINFENAERQNESGVVFEAVKNHEHFMPFPPHLYKALKLLWNDSGVHEAYKRRIEFQLNDNAQYYLDNIERMNEDNYIPTAQDVLFARSATIGVREIQFFVKEATFRVFDVGGQKSERRKWIHCFDDVQAVIFITAVSEFDQTLREDRETNRLIDSLTLFEQICNNDY